MHAAKSYYLYGTFHLFLLSDDPPPPPPKDGGLLNWAGGGILQISSRNLLFTLGSVYSTDASGAGQMSETNNSNQT